MQLLVNQAESGGQHGAETGSCGKSLLTVKSGRSSMNRQNTKTEGTTGTDVEGEVHSGTSFNQRIRAVKNKTQ